MALLLILAVVLIDLAVRYLLRRPRVSARPTAPGTPLSAL